MQEESGNPFVRLYGIGVDPRTSAWSRGYSVRDLDGQMSRVAVPFAAGEHELFPGRIRAGPSPS